MALTADEEAGLRALLAAARKLPDAPTRSREVPDEKTRVALGALEAHLRAIASALRKV